MVRLTLSFKDPEKSEDTTQIHNRHMNIRYATKWCSSHYVTVHSQLHRAMSLHSFVKSQSKSEVTLPTIKLSSANSSVEGVSLEEGGANDVGVSTDDDTFIHAYSSFESYRDHGIKRPREGTRREGFARAEEGEA